MLEIRDILDAAKSARLFQLGLGAGLLLGASALIAPVAQAHINMTGALLSRDGDQKSVPCDGKRGDGPIYNFEPGTTITLAVSEAIPHPSYFRIAFDQDGQDFVEPKSIKPIDPSRACPYDANDQCGEADYCTVQSDPGGATVLWDNLDPHMPGLGASYTWKVKLPDVECDNCTIQVIQVMEDTVHGAYCPQGSCSTKCDANGCTKGDAQDLYHRCIDITLKKGAKNSAGVATGEPMNKGTKCAKDEAPPASNTSDAGSSSKPDATVVSSGNTNSGADSGSHSSPSSHDAASGSTGAGSSSDDGDSNGDDGEPAASTGNKDAGKTTTKKPDAGTSSSAEEPNSSSDSGCSVARTERSTSSALLGLLLTFGAVAIKRKRARRLQG